MRYLIVTGIGCICLAGCATNKPDAVAAHRNSEAMANAIEHDDSKFDLVKDPPLTAHTICAAGDLAESQGQPDHAIEQYQQALKLEPKNTDVLYRLAIVQTQTRKFADAIASWKLYVEATNRSAGAYSNLAFCYDVSGNAPEAEGAYRLGITRDPANQACRVNLGLMLARLGRADEALDQLTVVLSPAEAHYDLGSLYQQMNKNDQAKLEFNKSLQFNPQMWEARAQLAKIE